MLSDLLGIPLYYLRVFKKLPEDTFQHRFLKARKYRGLTKRETTQLFKT
ncbi:hypothetical protein GCM10008968_20870 [Bacillus horti]